MKRIWELTRDTFKEFSQDRVLRLAAATAYYAVFSIGPLLVLVVGLAGLAFGPERVRVEVTRQVESFVGEKSAKVVDSMMSAQHAGGSLLATLIGGGALLMGAAGVFGQLQDSLNAIWGVTTMPGRSIGAFVRDRFFSLAMVLGIGFLLLVSMVLTAVVNAFAGYIGGLMALPKWVAPAGNDVVSLVVITLLFGLIFMVLPDVRLRWRQVWVGALLTAVLFSAGKFLLGLYLSHEINASSYGAGSAFVVILLYVYYSSVILYLGAAFTKVYATRGGARVVPARYAVHMTGMELAQQGMPRDEHVAAVARGALGGKGSPGGEGEGGSTALGEMGERRPVDGVAASPGSFVLMGVGAGLAAGLAWRSNTGRKAIKLQET